MIGRRVLSLLLAAFLLSLPPAGGRDEPKKAPASAPKEAKPVNKNRHALLVAVTFYENLSESKHLKGPANDTELVYKLLVEKLDFSPEQIMILSEKAGKEKGKDFLPTRKNIVRELNRLAKVAKPGEQVMIHMGGHGSQQPEQPNAPEPKPDGLDETFLPRDIGKWNDSTGSVENAIMGHEMGVWLTAIRDTKASVWITFDSCHSGTMARGGDDKEVTRDVNPLTELGIPKKALDEAREKARIREAKKPEKMRGGPPPAPVQFANPGGITAIYAAQSSEVTLEREMPPKTENGTVHGLLTYTMVMVMTEALEKSKEPITYGELARRIQSQYVAWGRTFPTPLIEGGDKDREILGDKVWPGRSSMFLNTRDGLKVNAGAIHGLTTGSILSVKPPPGKGEQNLGYVLIGELRPFDADVEPCDENGKKAKAEFPDGAACTKFFVDVGDQRLRTAADPLDSTGKPIAADLRKQITEALKKVAETNPRIQVVDKVSEADWLVRRWGDTGQDIVLVPGSGWSVGRDAVESGAYGAVRVDDALHIWLNQNLTGIARADSLKKLAASFAAGAEGGVKVKLEIVRFRSKTDRRDPIPVAWPAPEITAYDRESMGFRMTNQGRTPIDVTLLYVDSDYGVSCIYPVGGSINRLRPTDVLMVPSSAQQSFTISTKTTGSEQLILIAVKAQGQSVDFSALEQKPLERAVKRDVIYKKIERAKESPLARLLNAGNTGEATMRGLTVEEESEHAMMVVPFRVTPGKRPAPE